ncbi:TetR/AcrR family transcriptional regulator C-terminal domain-containing protein [Streptomyces coeruleorubidus]|uniref:TetR/AcrR family transcriptional regulator C-terminal domain-containing protein n=1 Tax=Streptomyces coeruleorubidus TaxID=116188 RepID=UPI003F53D9C1
MPGDPRERIVTAATAMHDALTAWPWAAEVLSADGFVGLLDESAMWMVETIVAGAGDHGCTPEQSVDVFRHIWYYTVGEVLVRAHSARRRDEGRPFAYRDDLDPSRLPHLAAIGVRWAALAARDIYPEGLRTFVDGLLAQGEERA